jgi:hypothetical protein
MTACNLQQRIESYIASALLTYAKAAQAITVQFAIYNNTGSSLTVKVATGYASSQDNFGTVTSDLAATNMQAISNGSAGVVAYTLSPNVNLANGYQVQLQFGGGLNAGSGYVDIGFADIRVTAGVSTGTNAVPPPPELRTAQSEMAYCHRYFFDAANGGSTPAWNMYNYAGGAATLAQAFFTTLPVPMRATPTFTTRNVTGAGVTTAFNGATALSVISINWSFTTSGAGGFGGSWNFTASAEL